MSKIEQHKKIKRLIESKAIIPGILSEENGIKVYNPISLDEYNKMIDNGNINELAYNTFSMGRGIFALGDNGEIINFKGVDSRLEDKDNIAVGKVNATVYDISQILGYEQSPHRITVVNFPNQSSEIRVRGASQLQNLLNEKQKLDESRKKDKKGLIKFPTITEIEPFSKEFCEKIGLPKVEMLTTDFLKQLSERHKEKIGRTGGRLGNYAYICLEYMQQIGMSISEKNQTWQEYFSNLSEQDYAKIKDIPDLESAIKKQDNEYELGASFGQATRILENPFRIMDLAHFVDSKNTDAVKSIMEYTSDKYDEDYLSYYAKTMGRNLAGFMNLGLACNNWSHRQDFSLSAEMCDDAYDDVRQSIIDARTIKKNDSYYNYIMKNTKIYYNQIFLFASNMKIIEDAYKMMGKEIPKDYKEQFIDAFMENIENKDEILKNIHSENLGSLQTMLRVIGGKDAIRNFEGFEEYVENFRQMMTRKIEEERGTEKIEDKIANFITGIAHSYFGDDDSKCKDGFVDCMNDDKTRVSNMQNATIATRNNVLGDANIEHTDNGQNLE